mgnify:CR=1 FL=1
MKAIIMMFDTLTRKYLSAYGNEWVHTPEFKRLEAHTVTFDNFRVCRPGGICIRADAAFCTVCGDRWNPLMFR